MKKNSLNGSPKLSWTFLDGSKRAAGALETVIIGKGKYLPGWQWSKHIGAITGKKSKAHIGYVLSGEMIIQNSKGVKIKVGPGEAFEVGPGHDAWVSGKKSCTALDFAYL